MASRKGSRAKGNSSELVVCRLLSEWWDNISYQGVKAEELPFRRSPLSGGWDRKRAAGDIIKPPSCHLVIEVKNRMAWDWDGLLKKNPKWPIHEWWKQTTDAVQNDHEVPILIFTKNYHPWYIALTHKEFSRFDRIPSIQYPGLEFAFGYLDDFIKLVDPDLIGKECFSQEEKDAEV